MCKCCEVKFFPNDSSAMQCGNCFITYKLIFALQTIGTVLYHFFDIGSDIAILVDLSNNNSEYFVLSLIIILLPVFATFVRTTQTLRGENYSCKCFLSVLFAFYIHSVLQFGFLKQAKENIKRGRNTEGFIETRLRESLLESAPESLLQLFIILKSASTYTYNQILFYYLSISLSVFSLIMSLVSYEINSHNSYIHILQLPKRIMAGLKIDDDENREFTITDNNLKFNTRYVILLTFYRLTEVISRIGLLACIGVIYDGYVIIWFLLADFLTSFLLYLLKKVNNNCKFLEYEEKHAEGRRYSGRIDGNNFVEYCSIKKTVVVNMNRLVERMKNLPVYAYHFIKFIFLKNSEDFRKNPTETQKAIEYRRQRTIYLLKFHFISKILNNLVLTALIIYNICNYSFSTSLYVISIVSMSAFVINLPILYIMKLYISNYKNYEYIFKPINCSLFCCKCFCKCCCKKVKVESIENKKENKQEVKAETKIDDIISNMINNDKVDDSKKFENFDNLFKVLDNGLKELENVLEDKAEELDELGFNKSI